MDETPEKLIDQAVIDRDRRYRKAYLNGFLAAAAIIEDGASFMAVRQFVENELRPWKEAYDGKRDWPPRFDPRKYQS